ncbi:MAG TPA: hypothetical protein VGH19_00165 [Verrucomicrobiae bacterium]
MRMTALFRSFGVALATTFLLGNTFTATADDKTAFDLAKDGNKYVGEQAKDKVVQIRSDKSVGSTTPNVWYVVYRDETATMKTVEVKFGAGKMMDVKRPMRLLEPISDKNNILDEKKLKTDSDKALKVALKEPILENLKITASEMKLERGAIGEPVWKISLWAAKLKSSKDVKVGEIWLDCENGKVSKIDITPKRVD